MIEPTSGTIWLDDTDTASMPAHELRRQIGYVIQHAGLFPHRTIVDNIATVPFLLGTDKKQARARAMELLERVGLDPAFAKRYPAQLSGGQQQRVGVARALAADPPVMLMDEPFCAVDPVVREQLQEEFLRLQGELGKTIVFVTHDIDEAIKLGDQVAVLRVGGTLAQLATPAELLSRPVRRVRRRVRRARPRLPGARASRAPARSPTHEEPTVALGEPAARAATRLAARWSTTRGAPQGWLHLGDEPHGAVVEDRSCYRGGTLATQGGTLRAALDACLSSPSGRGVVVDERRPAGRLGHRPRGARPDRGQGQRPRDAATPARQRELLAAATSGATSSTTARGPRLALGPHLALGRARSWSGCCSRCRSAGSRAATAGSTRR